jgi:hypothetical protein
VFLREISLHLSNLTQRFQADRKKKSKRTATVNIKIEQKTKEKQGALPAERYILKRVPEEFRNSDYMKLCNFFFIRILRMLYGIDQNSAVFSRIPCLRTQ